SAVVPNLQAHLRSTYGYANVDRSRARMPVDVGQALLDRTEQGDLDVRGQPHAFGRDVESDRNPAATGELIYIPARRRIESGLVEQGWMQKVRNRPDLSQASVHNIGAVGDQFALFVGRIRQA